MTAQPGHRQDARDEVGEDRPEQSTASPPRRAASAYRSQPAPIRVRRIERRRAARTARRGMARTVAQVSDGAPLPAPDSSRPPGVAPLGAARGGPATFAGVDYQVTVMLHWTLLLLDEVRRHPSRAIRLRVEPRTLVDDGQVGDDVAWDGSKQEARRAEVKANPSAQDVYEFVERLSALDGGERSVVLIAGSPTSAYQDLELAVRLAREACDADEFAALVNSHADTRPNLRRIVTKAGDDPRSVLRRSGPPETMPDRGTDRQVRQAADAAASAGRGHDLYLRLNHRLRAAAAHRETVDLAELARELEANGFLEPVTTVDYTDQTDTALAALALLEGLPVPLPLAVLAATVAVSVEELTEQLAEPIAAGRVRVVDGHISSTLRGVSHPLAATHRAQALLGLTTSSGVDPVTWSQQAPNIRRLAQLISDRPKYVADAFVAFEKGAKRFGDLWLTYELARMAYRACAEAGEGADVTEVRRLKDNKVRSLICGISWVLQRVGELDQADDALTEAHELNAGTTDVANDAFLDKCRGRLKRMLAEQIEVGAPHRQAHLEDSIRLLSQAYGKFESLVHEGERHRIEDLGECQSLLARTYWEAERPEDARNAADRARPILNAVATSKATADLVILELEMDLSEHNDLMLDGDTPDTDHLDAGVARLTELIATYSEEPFAGGREPSEIVARALLLRARLATAKHDLDAALADLDHAARLYRDMNYRAAAEDAELKQLVLRGSIPSGLHAELELRAATTAVRVRAARQAASMNGDNEVDPAIWASLVRNAEFQAALTAPRWDWQLPLGA